MKQNGEKGERNRNIYVFLVMGWVFDLNDDHCRMQIVSFIVFHRIMKIMGI